MPMYHGTAQLAATNMPMEIVTPCSFPMKTVPQLCRASATSCTLVDRVRGCTIYATVLARSAAKKNALLPVH
jgi:hypothetical protein